MRSRKFLTRRLKRGGGKEELEQLGIDTNQPLTLSKADINRAYRKKSRGVHPDRNKNPDATDNMRKLNDARDVLLRKANSGSYHYVPSQQAAQAVPQPRTQAAPQPSGYNFGDFERRNANRAPPPGGPGRGFESSPPRATNFTRSERATQNDTRRKTPSPKKNPSPKGETDVWARLRQLERDVVGSPPSGDSGSDDEWLDSDLLLERHRRHKPQPKPNYNPKSNKW